MNWARRTAATVILWIGAVVAGDMVPSTATANPGDASCPLAMSIVCRFVPIAPDLDDDVDLTKQPPPTDPAAPLPDPPPLADVAAGS